MSIEEINEKVKNFLVEDLEIDENKIEGGARLKEDLGIDSLSMMLLSLAVEEKFKMRFDPAAPTPTTVGEVCDAVIAAL